MRISLHIPLCASILAACASALYFWSPGSSLDSRSPGSPGAIDNRPSVATGLAQDAPKPALLGRGAAEDPFPSNAAADRTWPAEAEWRPPEHRGFPEKVLPSSQRESAVLSSSGSASGTVTSSTLARPANPAPPTARTPQSPLAVAQGIAPVLPSANLAPESEAVEVSVPQGASLPLVLGEAAPISALPANAAQLEIVDSMSMKFAKDASRMETEHRNAAAPESEYVDLWSEAVSKSDRQFHALFGDEAYMRWSIRNRVQQFESQQGNSGHNPP